MNKEEILPGNHPQSPFYHNLPKQDAKPIDELVKFFKQYKNLVKNLLNYFKEISLVKEFESNLHYQLLNSYGSKVSSPGPNTEPKRPNLLKSKSNTNQNFMKNVSSPQNSPGGTSSSSSSLSNSKDVVNSINSLVINHHNHHYQTNLKFHKELTHKLIPKLETLLKNLSNKIREIRSSLKNESFANDSILKEISKTGAVLKTYMNAVELYNSQDVLMDNDENDMANEDIDPDAKLDDPFLIKLRLNYQLKNQLVKENYLFAAFINLQNISKDLLVYILKDLNQIFERFDKMTNFNYKQFVNFDPHLEWQNFVANNPNFLNVYVDSSANPKREIRHFKNIIIPYSNSIHNKCIRFGIVYKKSKLLKNYNRFYYLLTCNYLHEFKIENHQQQGQNQGQNHHTTNHHSQNQNQNAANTTNAKHKLMGFINHNDVPVKSYNLNNYKIIIKNEKNFKFNLLQISTGKQATFKCNNINDFQNWVQDLSDLLQFEHDNRQRYEFVEKKLANRNHHNHKFFENQNDSKSSLMNVPDISISSETVPKFTHQRTSSSLSQTSMQSSAPSLPIQGNTVPSSVSQSVEGAPAKKAPSHINLTPSTNSSPSGSIQTPKELGVNNANTHSLQGIFTPIIKTPSSSGSDRNPFDQSFVTSFDHTSPSHSGTTSPGSASVSAHHEGYLKIQQEYLKQQQEMIDMKLKETQMQQEQQAQQSQQSQPDVQGKTENVRSAEKSTHEKSESVGSVSSAPYRNDSDSNSNSNSSSHVNLNNLSIYSGTPKQRPNSPARNPTQDSISSNHSNSCDSIKSLENSKINNFLQQNESLVVPKFFVTDEDNDKTDIEN